MRELYPKGFLQEFSRQRSSIEFIVLKVSLNEFKQVLSFKSYIISFYSVVQKKTFLVRLTRQETSPLRSSYFGRSQYLLCGEFFMRSEFYREIERNISFLRSRGNFALFPPRCAADQHSRKILKSGSRMFS